MREYIVNLTNNLIGNYRFDLLSMSIKEPDSFRRYVKQGLEVAVVREMSPETLGKVMCSFEMGDVITSQQEISEHVRYHGDGTMFLRELVSFCLARVIYARLCPDSVLQSVMPIPPYIPPRRHQD